MGEILIINQVDKIYTSGEKQLKVLDGINLKIHQGETAAIIGPSGSGKTTLLGLCAGLDKPTNGFVSLCGQKLQDLNEDELATLRNHKVGFVFQNFQLIPTLTALENVMIPLELLKKPNARERAKELLAGVGLLKRYDHYPSQLSGGEQQRVSIARAFANDPEILFADEPTGNLDDDTGAKIESLLFELNEKKNTTLILVTHDSELAEKTDRSIRLKGGKVFSDTKREKVLS